MVKLKIHRVSHTGAVLLELAVSIPLLLLIAFFALWFSVVQNLRAQLDFVVTNAPFVALARGNSQFYGNGGVGGGIEMVNDFLASIPANQTNIPRALFYRSGGVSISEDALQYYGKYGGGDWAVTGFDVDGNLTYESRSIWNHPSNYIKYSSANLLAAAYEGLHLGVGNTLNYPCSPASTPGCAKCRVILPPEADQTSFDNPIKVPPQLQLICAASPPEPFYSLFKAGMRMFGGTDVAKPILVASTIPAYTGGDEGGGGGGMGD